MMTLRTRMVNQVEHGLFEFGATAVTRIGPTKCAELSAVDTLAIADAADPNGRELLRWHFENREGYDYRDATDEVDRWLHNHRHALAGGTETRERALKAVWVPHLIAVALVQGPAPKTKLRPGEIWVAVIHDFKAKRCPVNYFTPC